MILLISVHGVQCSDVIPWELPVPDGEFIHTEAAVVRTRSETVPTNHQPAGPGSVRTWRLVQSTSGKLSIVVDSVARIRSTEYKNELKPTCRKLSHGGCKTSVIYVEEDPTRVMWFWIIGLKPVLRLKILQLRVLEELVFQTTMTWNYWLNDPKFN